MKSLSKANYIIERLNFAKNLIILWSLIECASITILAGTPGVGVRSCARLFIKYKKEQRLNLDAEQSHFIQEIYLPVVGKRGLFDQQGVIHPCQSKKDCLVFIQPTPGPDISFEWHGGLEAPQIHSSPSKLTLRIPKGFDWNRLEDRGSGLIKRLLLPSSLHPHTVPMPNNDVATLNRCRNSLLNTPVEQ